MTPAWLLDAVAALMLAVAAVSAARLVKARAFPRAEARARVFGLRSAGARDERLSDEGENRGFGRAEASGASTDTDLAHLLMAVAMAGMLAPSLRTLPDVPWEIIFGLLAAWFAVRVASDARANGVRALAGGHCAPHFVHSCAMLYMFLALTATGAGAGGMSAMTGTAGGPAMTLAHPTIALLFAFILVGYSIWDLDQLSGRRYSLATARVSLAGVAAPGSSVPVRPAGREPDPADGEAVAAGDRAGAAGFLLSPAVTIGCRVAMGVAMAFMLFIAI